jgi:hypothetical protein
MARKWQANTSRYHVVEPPRRCRGVGRSGCHSSSGDGSCAAVTHYTDAIPGPLPRQPGLNQCRRTSLSSARVCHNLQPSGTDFHDVRFVEQWGHAFNGQSVSSVTSFPGSSLAPGCSPTDIQSQATVEPSLQSPYRASQQGGQDHTRKPTCETLQQACDLPRPLYGGMHGSDPYGYYPQGLTAPHHVLPSITPAPEGNIEFRLSDPMQFHQSLTSDRLEILPRGDARQLDSVPDSGANFIALDSLDPGIAAVGTANWHLHLHGNGHDVQTPVSMIRQEEMYSLLPDTSNLTDAAAQIPMLSQFDIPADAEADHFHEPFLDNPGTLETPVPFDDTVLGLEAETTDVTAGSGPLLGPEVIFLSDLISEHAPLEGPDGNARW